MSVLLLTNKVLTDATVALFSYTSLQTSGPVQTRKQNETTMKTLPDIIADLYCACERAATLELANHGQTSHWHAYADAIINAKYAVQKAQRLGCALSQLYTETADYIRLNNLGDVHHNASMQDARDALSESMTDIDKIIPDIVRLEQERRELLETLIELRESQRNPCADDSPEQDALMLRVDRVIDEASKPITKPIA